MDTKKNKLAIHLIGEFISIYGDTYDDDNQGARLSLLDWRHFIWIDRNKCSCLDG